MKGTSMVLRSVCCLILAAALLTGCGSKTEDSGQEKETTSDIGISTESSSEDNGLTDSRDPDPETEVENDQEYENSSDEEDAEQESQDYADTYEGTDEDTDDEQYDIYAYCDDLMDENQDVNLYASLLFEDGDVALVGLIWDDEDTGGERRGSIAVATGEAGQNASVEDYRCSKCSGNGYIYENDANRQVCSICGGTGWQYIPNAYYDAIMGWRGQDQLCSGCAGSGYINYGDYELCDKCDGYGVSM